MLDRCRTSWTRQGLPESRIQGREVLVSSSPDSGKPEKRVSNSVLVRRGRVLRKPELGPTNDASQAISIEFLMAFVQALIRKNPSDDLIMLALMSASNDVPITKEQRTAFMRAIMQVQAGSPWPKGFF